MLPRSASLALFLSFVMVCPAIAAEKKSDQMPDTGMSMKGKKPAFDPRPVQIGHELNPATPGSHPAPPPKPTIIQYGPDGITPIRPAIDITPIMTEPGPVDFSVPAGYWYGPGDSSRPTRRPSKPNMMQGAEVDELFYPAPPNRVPSVSGYGPDGIPLPDKKKPVKPLFGDETGQETIQSITNFDENGKPTTVATFGPDGTPITVPAVDSDGDGVEDSADAYPDNPVYWGGPGDPSLLPEPTGPAQTTIKIGDTTYDIEGLR